VLAKQLIVHKIAAAKRVFDPFFTVVGDGRGLVNVFEVCSRIFLILGGEGARAYKVVHMFSKFLHRQLVEIPGAFLAPICRVFIALFAFFHGTQISRNCH
jgi:hypothetical protein